MKQLLILLAFSTLAFSDAFEDMKSQMAQDMQAMKQDFTKMKSAQEKEFASYQEGLQKEYSNYKKELNVYWDNPKLSSKKDWVSYSADNKTRSDVNFEDNVVTIETVAKSKEEALQNIKKKLSYTVSANTKTVSETDPLQKRIAKLEHPKTVVTSKVDNKPILATVLFKTKPSKKELKAYVNKVVSKTTLKVSNSKSPHNKVYKISVALPKNTTLKRSKAYALEVKTNAKRFDLPPPLIFAIMQTESNFNPFAKSHIPAFGLMQIVPRSAGVDSYKFLKKKERMPTASYLYNSKNNIEMGSSYLHILYYRYLKKIEDPVSRLYCTIAAYNTGSGNIAWAFTRKHNMNKAAPKINALSSEQVYKKLLSSLRYDEPKHYLKRVRKRMSAYKKAYPDI